MTERRRVVITGMGAVTPIGHSVDDSVARLKAHEHGVRFMPEWEFIDDLQCRIAATVGGIDFQKRYHRRVRRTMGRVALLALHASEQAIAQAGLTEELLEGGRTGLAYGSTSGSSGELELYSRPLMYSNSMRGLQSNAYLRIMTHTCAANLASHFKVRGRVQPTCSACTSGSQAVGYGYEMIRAGIEDVMICGGAEEMHYTSAITFDLLMATSAHFNDRPDESPRPFDTGRDGLVTGEAGATMVLEEYEHAKSRGAEILGEVLGYASCCDGAHITQPNPKGMRRVIDLALEDARVSKDSVDYVHAHATATPIGDVAEAQATHAVFERPVPIASTKGHVGHTLGACGALEAIWSMQMIREGFLAGTRNLVDLDPECPPLDYVRETRDAKPQVVVSNNFAFGGVNTSLVLGPTP
ncbi:MAG: beta-ketoacyl-ACP synthase [Deltaproteobacteria bacterium]|nr:beta-ketoacyl-ACP synthase [Deltaproteobacteria bacterium]